MGLQWFRNYSGWYHQKIQRTREISLHTGRDKIRGLHDRQTLNQESYSYDSVLESNFQKLLRGLKNTNFKFIFKNADISSWGLKRRALACYQSSVQKPAYLMIQCRISIASVNQMCTLPVQWPVCTPGKTPYLLKRIYRRHQGMSWIFEKGDAKPHTTSNMPTWLHSRV